MPINPGFYPYVFALLLSAVLWAAMPSGAYCATGTNDLLTVADAALKDEMYEIAEQNIRQYLSLIADTNQPKTEYIIMLARALRGQKRYPEMLELLVQNRKEPLDEAFADSFAFWLALAFYENSHWETTLEQINNFESRYPDSALIPDIIRLKAKALLKLNRDNEAVHAMERLIRDKNNAEIDNDRLFLGQILADSGRADEACAILEKLLSFPPDTSIGQECRCILGRIYTDRKQWQKARLVYDPLISQSNIPDGYRRQAIEALAEMAVAQTNFSEALSILENGSRRLSNPLLQNELSLRKGALLLKMNKIEEGTVLIHNFVRSQTNNVLGARIQLELAQALLAGDQNEKALVEFQNLLEGFAAQVDLTAAYAGKGTVLFNLGRYHEAAAAFGKAEETSQKPETKAQYRYRTADALFALGQFKPAAETYASVVGVMPATPLANMALFQTAECQLQIENFPEAETLFWKVYDEDPADALAPRALLRIADVLLRQNKLRAAETIYAWINQDYPGQWPARSIYGLGVIAYRSGRYADALKYFEDTLRRAAGGDEEIAAAATYMSGWTCFMLNKTDEARRRFSEVVSSYRHSSKAPEALFWLGEHDYNSGHYDSAEKSFRRLVEDYPAAALADEALFWAGRAALMQNEFRKGRDYFSTLIKNYPASDKRTEGRYFQGVALCELGQFDAAILIFNEIIKQNPDHEAAAFKKADCLFILGSDDPQRYEAAAASYQLILDRPECSAATRLQARYKIGRCLEKLGKADEAVSQYLQVVYSYLQNQEQTPAGNLWFARAAFSAAGIMEGKQQWRQAGNIYQRVVEADIPASSDAQERIDKLRTEHWLSFY